MMKTHLLINNDGLTSCGRNVYKESLDWDKDVDKCDCKSCLKFNKSISRFDVGPRYGKVLKFGDDIIKW